MDKRLVFRKIKQLRLGFAYVSLDQRRLEGRMGVEGEFSSPFETNTPPEHCIGRVVFIRSG